MTRKHENLLFLTGKLAEKRLHRILESMQPLEFSYEVRNIGISVAALMTARMIARRLSDYEKFDRILVPGLCGGDLEALSGTLKIQVQRGPVDLKDLPAFFGREGKPFDLTDYRVNIFAEIVDAPLIPVEEIIQRAVAYRDDGADVIDIGCLPDTPFPHLEEAVRALAENGFRVSVDSLDEDELLRGGKSGADYLLSLKESTLWLADEVASVPVLIPESHTDMDSLFRIIDRFSRSGRPFIADSILDPVHFGFTASILRYSQLRSACPDIRIMMGTGNMTELTEADTTGINAVLFGIISEMDITDVLTTQVSPHACTVVRESDRARRIMHAAKQDQCLPKDVDNGLLTTHSRDPFPYSQEEIEELAGEVRDPSYRIQISKEGINVYNREGITIAASPFDLYEKLELIHEDAPHAFYMGVELARAEIASQLGKRYYQDELLDWGVVSPVGKDEDRRSAKNIAHTLRDTKDSEYKEAGATMKSGKKRRKR